MFSISYNLHTLNTEKVEVKKFEFPKSPKLKYVNTLIKFVSEVLQTKDEKVVFDLSKTEELDSLAIAYLCGLADLTLENNHLTVRYKSNKKIKSVIQILDDSITNKTFSDIEIGNNRFQFCKVTSNNSIFIDRMLTLLQGELSFGEETKGSLRVVLTELLTNAIDHSGERACYICLGRWPNSRYLHLVCLDFGVGIPTKLRTRYPELETDNLAFKIQHEKGLTTRTKRDGGKGYKLIRDILKANKGRLNIISNKAKVSYKYDKGDYKISNAKISFSGTCVDIQFNPSNSGFDKIILDQKIEEFF